MGNLLDMSVLWPHPRLAESVFPSPSGDFNAYYSLRCPTLMLAPPTRLAKGSDPSSFTTFSVWLFWRPKAEVPLVTCEGGELIANLRTGAGVEGYHEPRQLWGPSPLCLFSPRSLPPVPGSSLHRSNPFLPTLLFLHSWYLPLIYHDPTMRSEPLHPFAFPLPNWNIFSI